MKKIFLLFLLATFSLASFSQKVALSKDEYLAKSKRQKTTAWVMLGGGASLILAGLAVGNRNESSFSEAGTGVILGGIGLVSMIASIPTFISAGKNKKRGMGLAFTNEGVPLLQNGSFTKLSCPSVTLRIRL